MLRNGFAAFVAPIALAAASVAAAAPADSKAEDASRLIVRELQPLLNPSFEDGLKGWNLNYVRERPVACESAPVAGDAAGAKKCLLVRVAPNGERLTQHLWTYVCQDMRLDVDKKYWVRCRVKGTGLAWGSIRVTGGAAGEPSSKAANFDQDWTEVGACFTATTRKQDKSGKSICQVRLHIDADGPGTVAFDDFSVVEVRTYQPYLRVTLLDPPVTDWTATATSYDQERYHNTPGPKPNAFWLNPVTSSGGIKTVATGLHLIPSKKGEKFERIRVRVELAAAPDAASVVKTLETETPGDTVGLLLPDADLQPPEFLRNFQWVADDIRERSSQVRALALPPVEIKQFFVETGLLGFGKFYTDPDLLATEIGTLRAIGFNSLTTDYSGLTGIHRDIAGRLGIVKTHQTIRAINTLPTRLHREPRGTALPYDPDRIRQVLREETARMAERVLADPAQIPMIRHINLGDEIAGQPFTGELYDRDYRDYLRANGLTPDAFGKTRWEDVRTAGSWHWREVAKNRPADRADLPACRNYYWTLRFWNYTTARLYRMAAEEIGRVLPPAIPVCVNHAPPWGGHMTLLQGADVFEMVRQGAVTAVLNEDWLNTYGWRNGGIQLNALLTDFGRAAARQKNVPVFAYVMPEADDKIELKMASVIGKGCKHLNLYNYGPQFANCNHWSNNLGEVRGVSEFLRRLAPAEDVLFPAQPLPASVAILWSTTDSLWTDSRAGLWDQMLIYLALQHDQIPVEFIDEEEVARGGLQRFRAAVLIPQYLRADAQNAVADWVRAGGWLWADGAAAMGDEYGQPSALLNPVFGVASREIVQSAAGNFEPQHGLPVQKPLDTITFDPTGKTWPALGVKVRLQPADGAQCVVRGRYADNSPAVLERACDKGRAFVAGSYPGLAYAVPVQRIRTKIETGYRAEDRAVVTQFLLQSGLERPVLCSVPMIEVDLLTGPAGSAVVLANYTGAPQDRVALQVRADAAPGAVVSISRGPVPFRFDAAARRVTCELPLDAVDFVLLKPKP